MVKRGASTSRSEGEAAEGVEVRASLHFRNLWGSTKHAQLSEETRQGDFHALPYEAIHPTPEIGYPFTPHTIGANYFSWLLLSELFPVSFPGVQTKRDEFVVDIDRERLNSRIKTYFDPA